MNRSKRGPLSSGRSFIPQQIPHPRRNPPSRRFTLTCRRPIPDLPGVRGEVSREADQELIPARIRRQVVIQIFKGLDDEICEREKNIVVNCLVVIQSEIDVQRTGISDLERPILLPFVERQRQFLRQKINGRPGPIALRKGGFI